MSRRRESRPLRGPWRGRAGRGPSPVFHGASLALALALGACASPARTSAPEIPPPALDALLGGARTRAALSELAGSAELAPDQSIAVRELGRDAATSQHLVSIRERETPHRHDRHAIAVVLLRGHGAMLIGEAEEPVGPGSILYVPRGIRHAFRNASASPAVAYVIYVPPLEGVDRVEDPLPGDARLPRP